MSVEELRGVSGLLTREQLWQPIGRCYASRLSTKSRKFMGASKNRVTLKASDNVSPGRGPRAGSPHGVRVFALKPWVQKCSRRLFAGLKGLRGFVVGGFNLEVQLMQNRER